MMIRPFPRRLALTIFTTSLALTVNADPKPTTTGSDPAKTPVARAEPDGPRIKAARRPRALIKHGDVRQDPYYWLRDRNDPAVRAYLDAENGYADAVLATFKPSAADLDAEMRTHVNPSDQTVPFREGQYEYWERTEPDREYPVSLRRPVGAPKTEAVILDPNVLAAGHASISIGTEAVSNDGTRLAYSVDLLGDRRYEIFFKNLATGELDSERIKDTTGEVVWSADGAYVFYVKPDPETLRPRWVYRRKLHAKGADAIVYEEKDPLFNVGIGRSLTNRLIFIVSESKDVSEVSYLPTAQPESAPRVIEPRRDGVMYSVADGVDRFFIRTNLDAAEFRVVEAPVDHPSRDHWKNVVTSGPTRDVAELWAFRTHLVMRERQNGLSRWRVVDRRTNKSRFITFREPDYYVSSGANADYDATFFRYVFETMAKPDQTIDEDLKTGRRTIRRTRKVPGGFDARNYETKRIYAKAADGTKIPVSLVYRKGRRRGTKTPLLLWGYGSYGEVNDSYFTASRLPLLDRGFVYAVAHVRGGGEFGRPWYLDGKLMKKTNTFDDFRAVAHHLVDTKWTSSAHLYAQGESAGGLLMGAVINREPKLFRGVIARVPFVDVLTTMLDPSLPLTTGEYVEWGDPNSRDAYDYIKSYSPYDNVKPGPVPHLLVRGGFNDTNVPYWEPAKWVAKIRSMKTGDARVLLKTEMETGHDGHTGRFSYLKELAEDASFLLDLEK